MPNPKPTTYPRCTNLLSVNKLDRIFIFTRKLLASTPCITMDREPLI